MLKDSEPTPNLEKQLASLMGEPLFWFLPKIAIPQLLKEIQHSTGVYRWQTVSKTVDTHFSTLSASHKKMNEDACLILPFGEQYLLEAIIDGASSQKPIDGLERYGINGAWYISHLLSFGFQQSQEYQELIHRRHLTAGDVMRTINTWLHTELKKIPGVNYNDAVTVPGVAATFVLHDRQENLISTAHVADTTGCALLNDGSVHIFTPNQNKPFDDETMELARSLQAEYQCPLSALKTLIPTKMLLKAHMQKSFGKKINTPHGCGILNGMPELIIHNLIAEAKIDASLVRALVLFSDGVLLPHYEQGLDDITMKKKVSQIVLNIAPERVLANGYSILQSDDTFERIPRLKQFDDQTLLRIIYT